MSLSAAEVRKLALLARLDLSDDEVANVRPQLDSILAFVEQLTELDTTDVEPMTTALDVDNRWREDSQFDTLSNDEALANAPSQSDGCFLVPPVLGVVASKKS
ncbi:Asp-tRNA(Asn)/Glu-tRNA(Gln) amidotransferase subunit GatC [Rhodopirellula sp.]|nr:Asp-tRNA(Asn)/Glu-tRNA(Gln) amidotransferase subunit GatC [Rubripirellula sp.]MDB4476966.1 Asp-tRNA(Asn)/Glu-tRNA(Gln) amidotransferase subunit GatC [Rhodopirellula sp.]MDB4621836.1 Asp-tRNA(Asn)/Glu-tRNA(Gln) amidotransferase subunit GatC [Rubripirellula sp.]MDB4624638.1 Asp-tRNA(Asn)/Glu-tRNA(Gln) amidotransferase subunit GatC [Rubripirellula sp.]